MKIAPGCTKSSKFINSPIPGRPAVQGEVGVRLHVRLHGQRERDEGRPGGGPPGLGGVVRHRGGSRREGDRDQARPFDFGTFQFTNGLFLSPILRQFYNLNFFHGF